MCLSFFSVERPTAGGGTAASTSSSSAWRKMWSLFSDTTSSSSSSSSSRTSRTTAVTASASMSPKQRQQQEQEHQQLYRLPTPYSAAMAKARASEDKPQPSPEAPSSSLLDPASESLVQQQRSSSSAVEPRAFSYEELRAATNGFAPSSLLGEGGFGCVYKATLHLPSSSSSAHPVAVKQLKAHSHQGVKEWMAEVRFLGIMEHPNVVKLLGYCADEDEGRLLLVYEYMPKRSLEHHLFRSSSSASSPSSPPPLDWSTRLQILLGSARGLAYLHEEIPGVQVIFRDFKASNVLLDKDFTPKLSDFGLARQGPEMGASHVSTSVVGTMGYAAPEYLQTGHLTVKSDIWSFGVVLLEMISGRRSLDPNRPRNERVLLEWARPYLNGNKRIHCIIDPKLQGKYSLLQAERLVRLALECLNMYPRGRPRMSAVVQRLQDIIHISDQSDQNADLATTVHETKKQIRLKRQRRLNLGDMVCWFPRHVLA